MAFDHSRRRWFGVCSCKPTPRGLPSSVKQLRTSSAFRLFAVLVAHYSRYTGQVNSHRGGISNLRFRGLPGMWQDASSETSPSIDLRFTLVLESTKLNVRQREVVLCPSASEPVSALMKSTRLSAPVAWARSTV